jgi:hypothetical protein
MSNKAEEMLKKIKMLEKKTENIDKDAALAEQILNDSAKAKSLIKKAATEAKSVED